MDMNKAEWLSVLKVPMNCLNDDLKAFLKNNRGVITAWCNGEQVEIRMGARGVRWYSARNDKIGVSPDVELRLPPKITLSTTLTIIQAEGLYRVLEESTFNTEGSQAGRNAVMKSIENELRKVGH